MTALRVDNVSKIYRIYRSPADRLRELVTRRSRHRPFAALQDVSFTVSRGETLGIIGENGAGKSTLLKILAGTLKPTMGDVQIAGRVAALLELGAGFNFELSGEENIFLNAYLLGLKKAEIEQRRDAIIEFSELGDFIGRPVKTYSSGMTMRLAFSIAACVDPDVVIVDEALAVGDQHFQKKCVNRMMEFREQGKTTIFCTHSLYLVQELCDRCLWLNHGRIQLAGGIDDVVQAYADSMREKDAPLEDVVSERPSPGIPADPKGRVWIEDVRVVDRDGRESCRFRTGDDVLVRCVVRSSTVAEKSHVAFCLLRSDQLTVAFSTTHQDGMAAIELRDRTQIELRLPAIPLMSGQYYVRLYVGEEHGLRPFDERNSPMFKVEGQRVEQGIVALKHEWNT